MPSTIAGAVNQEFEEATAMQRIAGTDREATDVTRHLTQHRIDTITHVLAKRGRRNALICIAAKNPFGQFTINAAPRPVERIHPLHEDELQVSRSRETVRPLLLSVPCTAVVRSANPSNEGSPSRNWARIVPPRSAAETGLRRPW